MPKAAKASVVFFAAWDGVLSFIPEWKVLLSYSFFAFFISVVVIELSVLMPFTPNLQTEGKQQGNEEIVIEIER